MKINYTTNCRGTKSTIKSWFDRGTEYLKINTKSKVIVRPRDHLRISDRADSDAQISIELYENKITR